MDRKWEKFSKPSHIQYNPCVGWAREKLYTDREKTGDIKFMVGSEVIHAHRCVLAALSPKYEAQFYGAIRENNVVNVKDVSPAAFKQFIQFFYNERVTLTISNIEDVLNLAKQSLVNQLITVCVDFLMKVVGLDKLVWCYRLALIYDIKSLQEFCVEPIIANIKTVSQSTDFTSCELDVLCHILNQDPIHRNEVDMFEACISWAQSKCEQGGIEMPSTTDLRTILDDAVAKIRFRSMKVNEFAAIDKKYSGFHSPEESSNVFHAIVSIMESNAKKSHLECLCCTGPRTYCERPGNEFHFRCDKTINFNGFVMCDTIFEDILVYTSSATSIVKNTRSFSENQTHVLFEKPIQVKANEWHFFRVTNRKHNFGYMHLGVCSSSSNGVKFEFNKNFSKQSTLVTRLLFNIVD